MIRTALKARSTAERARQPCRGTKPRRADAPATTSLAPMILRMSTLFVRTLREDPADAEVPSHRLLVRAGYIRRAAPGHLHLAAAGPAGAAQRSRRSSARRWTRSAPRSCSSRRCCPREPYEATGRWTEYGDGIFRLKDRKGGDYLLGPTHEEMFTLVVKDLYSSYKDLPLCALPDPDQVPRRGAAPRRPAARPRVRDEGLLLLRRRRRRPRRVVRRAPRRLHPDLRPARLRVRHRQGDVRRDGRLEVRGVPGQGRRSARTPTSAARSCDYAANVEAVDVPRARTRAVRRRARRARRADARHPDHRHAGRPPQREVPPRRPALGGRRHAEERACRARAPRRHPRAARDRPARRPRGRPEAARGPARADRGRAVRTRPSFASTPRWSRATSGPARWARRARPASATSSTPASSRAPAGSPAPTSTAATCSTSWPAATSPPTARSRPPRSATATPARNCDERHARVRARHRDGPHLPARPQVRRGARPPGARRERQARHGHHGLLRHRCLARGRRDRRGHPRRARACAGRARSRPPTCTSSPPARTRRSSRPPSGSPPSCRPPGSTCSTTTGRKVSPGVKFKDAELIGVPDDRHRRPRPGRRHRRGQGPRAPASASEVAGRTRSSGSRRRAASARSSVRGVEAVIFDWGGTLTRWHDIDFHAESLALAQAVVDADRRRPARHAARLHAAGDIDLGAQPRPPAERDARATSSPRPGSTTTPTLLDAYHEFWEPHTRTDPEVGPLFERAARDGASRSACSPTRSGRGSGTGASSSATACSTSSTATSTPARSRGPSRRRRRSGRRWRRSASTDPAALRLRGRPALRRRLGRAATPGCARSTCRTARSRPSQVGHTEGEPDAVVHRLSDIPDVVAPWR